MTIQKCPHCQGKLKIVLHRVRTPAAARRGSFQQTAAGHVPTSAIGSLWYSLRGGILPGKPASNRKTLRVEEVRRDRQGMKIEDVDDRIYVDVIQDIARMFFGGHDWTVDNLARHTTMSTYKAKICQAEFKRLGYVVVSAGNETTVTHTGRRMLRGVLGM